MNQAQLFRRAAEASFENARELLVDAQLLHEHDRVARCLSLSVFGYEEVGKALVLTLAATSLVPGLGEGLLGEKIGRNPAKQHATKQFIVDIADIAIDQMRDYQSEMASLSDGAGASEGTISLADLLAELAAALQPALAREYARDYYKNIERAIRLDTPHRVPLDFTPEQRKWNGLYVDIQEGRVCRPGEVSGLHAFFEMNALETALEWIDALPRVLRNDASWDELVGHLQQRIV